jgi:hypothetical protein
MMKKVEGEEDGQKETNDDPTRSVRRAVAGMLSFTYSGRPLRARGSHQAVEQGADGALSGSRVINARRSREKHERGTEEKTNMRNGFSRKTLKSEQGPVELAIPRDREGSYDPLLVKKYQTSLTGFNEKILWMYAHGFSTRDIQAQLLEWYGVEVSPTLISNVTEAVIEEVRQWQNRPLEDLYPIMYVDWMPHQSARKPAYPQQSGVSGAGHH